MSEEAEFQRHMRDNPEDDIVRLVYADWLDEHGKPGSAARIRYAIEAKKHVKPTSGSPALRTGGLGLDDATIPEWLARANHVRQVREALREVPTGENENVKDLLHAAELHSYGLIGEHGRHAWYNHFNSLNMDEFEPHLPGRYYLEASLRAVLAPTHYAHDHVGHVAQAYVGRVGEENGASIRARHDRVTHETQLLGHYVRKHPVPDSNPSASPPVKLARPLGWLRDKLLGVREPVRQPGDGIVHRADNPTAVYAEHNAVMQAMRLLGGTAVATPENAHRYMNWIHGFVKSKPDHPIVRAYKNAAEQWHTGGTAGPELTQAVKPLVGVVNMLMHAAGKDQRFVKPASEALPTHPTAPVSSAPSMPAYEVVDPVDLSDAEEAPAEKLSVAERTRGILDALHKGGKEGAVKHLMEQHGYTDRAKALRHIREAVNRAKKPFTGPTKLAAYPGSGPINPEHVTGTTAARDPYTKESIAFRKPLVGTALAVHLRQIQQRHSDLGPAVEAALTGRAHGPTSARDDPFAEIGRALEKRNDPLANAHDWANMQQHLIHDAKVESEVRRLVRADPIIAAKEAKHGALSDHERDLAYWDAIARAHKSKNAEEFYTRLASKTGLDRAALLDSIERIRSRALDRAYTAAESSKPEWRGVMAHKLSRPYDTHTALFQAAHEGRAAGEHTPARILADHLQEIGRPGALALAYGAARAALGKNNPEEELANQTHYGHDIAPGVHAAVAYAPSNGLHYLTITHTDPATEHLQPWERRELSHTFPLRGRAHWDQVTADWSPEAKKQVGRFVPFGSAKLSRERDEWVKAKIKKIKADGVRGKPVDNKQAVAIAYSMWREKHGA